MTSLCTQHVVAPGGLLQRLSAAGSQSTMGKKSKNERPVLEHKASSRREKVVKDHNYQVPLRPDFGHFDQSKLVGSL